jgi:hypothetical protein
VVPVGLILIFILFALVGVEEIAATATSVSIANYIWLHNYECYVTNVRGSAICITEYTVFLKMN